MSTRPRNGALEADIMAQEQRVRRFHEITPSTRDGRATQTVGFHSKQQYCSELLGHASVRRVGMARMTVAYDAQNGGKSASTNRESHLLSAWKLMVRCAVTVDWTHGPGSSSSSSGSSSSSSSSSPEFQTGKG
ncbi:Serpin B7 [Manis pentadactyla]|nr:Serpin B7 [Manis pentadactyla]